MTENDFTSLIQGMGGKVIEEGSLTNENKTEVIPEKVVETTDSTKVDTTSETKTEVAAKVEEVKATETQKVEETKVAETKTTEVKAEVPVAEKKSYKAYDLVSNIDKEFKAEYGISMSAAQDIVSMNYDSEDMDERELVKDFFTAKTEGITDKEIDAKLRKFNILFKPQDEVDKMIENKELTDEQFNDLEAEWIGLNREAKNYLKEVQSKAQKMLDEFEVEQEYESSPTNEAGKKLAELTNSFLPTYNNVSVDIVDKDGKKVDTINFATDEAGKKLVSEIVSDPSNVYKMWMDDKGVIDVQKMVKDIYNLENRSKIDKAIYDHAHAVGAGSITKEISNIDFTKNNPNGGQTQKAIDPNLQALLNNLNGG
ncbi:MAG: hypothetical protein ACP5N7_01235 [Candidatus Pacearchaeota archaeon]